MKVKQSRQNQVYLGFEEAKTGTTSFGPMAGHVECVFYLILSMYLFLAANGPGIPVFGRFLFTKYVVHVWTLRFEKSKRFPRIRGVVCRQNVLYRYVMTGVV